MVFFLGHYKIQRFESTDCCILHSSKFFSKIDVLLQNDLFKVLSHRFGINHKKLNSFSKSL